MNKIIEIPVEKKGCIQIEVPVDVNKFQEAGLISEIKDKVDLKFEEILVTQIVNQCKTFGKAFEKIKEEKHKLVKAEAEFGLQFNAEGSLFIAKAATNANYKIRFEWNLE